jgi:UDP-N-acetylmuramyl pentapeptide synthase
VIVLADMLELGDQTELAHEMLLGPLGGLAPALFFGLGPRCRTLADTLADRGWDAAGFLKREELIEVLKAAVRPGDLVFFKGSHGYALERVAHELAPGAGIMNNE